MRSRPDLVRVTTRPTPRPVTAPALADESGVSLPGPCLSHVTGVVLKGLDLGGEAGPGSRLSHRFGENRDRRCASHACCPSQDSHRRRSWGCLWPPRRRGESAERRYSARFLPRRPGVWPGSLSRWTVSRFNVPVLGAFLDVSLRQSPSAPPRQGGIRETVIILCRIRRRRRSTSYPPPTRSRGYRRSDH
jgi:hypothetical protein